MTPIDSTAVRVSCPLCHTGAIHPDAQTSDDGWRCLRCGQLWTALRLATVAAYSEWNAARM